MLTASRARGVIGCREIDAQPPEDRCQDARGLTQRSVEEETERQGGFDGEIGRLEVPAPPADASRCPRGDRVRREPEGDVASPHESSVVLGPVPDAIRCLVLRMHARLHIEIMTRLRSRWSTCRPLLAHRAESAHQRRGRCLRHARLLRDSQHSGHDRRGAAGEDSQAVPTQPAVERSRWDDQKDQQDWTPSVEEGGRLSSTGPRRERVLPVQVDARRSTSKSDSRSASCRIGACVQCAQSNDRAWSTRVVRDRSVTNLRVGALGASFD